MASVRQLAVAVFIGSISSACVLAVHPSVDAGPTADPDGGTPPIRVDAGDLADGGEPQDAGAASEDASVPIEYPTLDGCTLTDATSGSARCGDDAPDAGTGCSPAQELDRGQCRYRCGDPCDEDADCPDSPGGGTCELAGPWGGHYCVYFAPLPQCCAARSWDTFSVRYYASPWSCNACDDAPDTECILEFRFDPPTGRLSWIHDYHLPARGEILIAETVLNDCDRQAVATLISASQVDCAPEYVNECQGADLPGCSVLAIGGGQTIERGVAWHAGLELPRPAYEARRALWAVVKRYFHPPHDCD